MIVNQGKLVANSRVACDNHFNGVIIIIIIIIIIITNLVKNNVFHNHIFIYYRNNYKYNIRTIIDHKYKFCCTKMKTIKFFS